MLHQLESTKAKWGGKCKAVDNWLQSRQDLLVSFCHLAGINSTSGSLPESTEITLFCESLVDYLSAGHFEVFDMLVKEDREGAALKQKFYPKLTKTTDAALRFNDRFAESMPAQEALFDEALADLGETLEERFKLEDSLISYLSFSADHKQNK